MLFVLFVLFMLFMLFMLFIQDKEGKAWYAERESNPHASKATDFKSVVSTISPPAQTVTKKGFEG